MRGRGGSTPSRIRRSMSPPVIGLGLRGITSSGGRHGSGGSFPVPLSIVSRGGSAMPELT